jgi:hypothetical protein
LLLVFVVIELLVGGVERGSRAGQQLAGSTEGDLGALIVLWVGGSGVQPLLPVNGGVHSCVWRPGKVCARLLPCAAQWYG